MILTAKQHKYLNYFFLGLQLVGLILSVEIGGWFTILYILANIIWAGWWCYENFEMLDNASDVILASMRNKPHYKGKIVEEKKKKKR